ncbi:macrophage mannose receptor 1-like [Patiria miniata]|uniref:C-type lectin domain-containing protein n=1 Tax=Patiria miniata TaxID=46514 RepID=A0A913ZA14_PATMI|nr:macrophage mannose receptor 1-like [Patiria miniata]
MYSFVLGAVFLAAVQVSASLIASPDPNSYRCPHGYQFYSGKCYKVVTVAKDHAAAQAHCESTGGTLASPNSQEEIDSIMDLVGQTTAVPDLLWLGYKDETYEGTFTDGSGKVLTHPTWSNGEPNNCCGGEHCLQLYRNSGLMNDLGCHREIGFVCSACSQDLSCRCPALWHEHDGDCYRFFGLPRSFEDGEANCQSYHNAHGQPAHLASVSCQAENDFITNFIAQSWPGQGLRRTWIGFNDIDHEGNFEWTDHLAEEYTNWKSGEPNDSNNNEDCTEINFEQPGIWNDLGCQTKQSSVCKMPVFDPYGACHKLADIITHLIGQCSAALPVQ